MKVSVNSAYFASVLCLVATFSCINQAKPNVGDNAEASLSANATRAIADCRATYRALKTYSDNMNFTREGPFIAAQHPKVGRVETIFDRTGLLRMDVRYFDKHDVLWFVDAKASAYFTEHDAYTTRGLSNLCSMVAHKTGGLAYYIPGLLMPNDMGAPDLFEENNVNTLSNRRESVAGISCKVLSGVVTSKEVELTINTSVWIGEKDNLIRKIETTLKLANSLSEKSVAVFQPEIGKTVERKAFTFVPPATAVKRD